VSTKTQKVYIETSCFIEIAKHKIGVGNPSRNEDVAALKRLLELAKDGTITAYTATLTIAECQHAEEPSSDGIPSDEVKRAFRDFLSSGQYVILIQDTVLVAERARNLRWVHGICLAGPDAVHAASSLELACDEFLSFDHKFHKNKGRLERIAISVRLPRNTKCIPVDPEPEPALATPVSGSLFDLLDAEDRKQDESSEGYSPSES
jgi:predicted nucleic acid-binding protein